MTDLDIIEKERALEMIERGLFARHKPYCTHERKWWQRVAEDGPCLCDDLRAALTTLQRYIEELEGKLDAVYKGWPGAGPRDYIAYLEAKVERLRALVARLAGEDPWELYAADGLVLTEDDKPWCRWCGAQKPEHRDDCAWAAAAALNPTEEK